MNFRSDMTVKLVQSMASDDMVVNAARVSTVGEASISESVTEEKKTGLINYLMRSRHGSPFESNALTFFVQAPIFVFREFMRHRIASYSEESGRFKQLQPVFYEPAPDRNLTQVGKPGAYTFEPGTIEQQHVVASRIRATSRQAYRAYEDMLDLGIAREVARMVLPLNIYSSMYVTMNARGLMNFLSLRVNSAESTFPSYPQREIEMVAEEMEKIFSDAMPLTHQAFVKSGRVAP